MGRFRVEVEERDFSGLKGTAYMEMQPIRYRRSVIGGCLDAEFSVRGAEDRLMELMDMLRCPLRLYYDNVLVWWGYISGVEIAMAGYTLGMSLDEMYNKVAVTYSLITTTESGEQELGNRATTDWVEDTLSEAEYGIKELVVSAGGMNETQANAARNRILETFSKPIPKITFGKVEKGGKVYAKGWWHTLDWRYHQNTITTSADTATIMAEMIGGGEFISGVTINGASGISGGRYRDGSLTIMDEVMKLIEIGTSNNRRLLVDITAERNAVISEEAQTVEYYAETLVYGDGRILDRYGNAKAVFKCPVGVAILSDLFVRAVDAGRMADARIIFIDEAEYSVSNGYLPIARGSISPWDIIERFTG